MSAQEALAQAKTALAFLNWLNLRLDQMMVELSEAA